MPALKHHSLFASDSQEKLGLFMGETASSEMSHRGARHAGSDSDDDVQEVPLTAVIRPPVPW